MKYQAIDGDYIREMKEYDEFLKEKDMMYKGMKYGYFIFIFIVILSALFSGNLVLAQTPNDLSYDFQNDNFYNSTNIEYDDSYNIKNHTEYTGHYNATYSFENEVIGISGEFIEFVDLFQSGNAGTATIISNIDGHNKVIKGYSDSDYIRIYNDFDSDQISGTIELWMRSNNTAGYALIQLMSGETINVRVFWVNDKIYYDNGTWQEIGSVVDDVWYHFRFDFECGAGLYKGLGADKFDVYLNGVKLGVGGYDFKVVADNLNRLRLEIASLIDYNIYWDAIGYSWSDGYTENNFDVSNEDTASEGIIWDGTHFWVAGWITDEVYKYTSEGVYTEIHFDTSGEDDNPMGITWNGTHFFMIGGEFDEIYAYTSEGVYTGIHFNISGEDTSPTGITWDGTYFWIIGTQSDEVYKYTSEGVYTGIHFDTSSEDISPSDITWDGTHFWVVATLSDEVYKYTLEGVYTGISFDTSGEGGSPRGITWNGISFWVIEGDSDFVYEYFGFNYTVGDNIVPYITVNQTIKEVDRWEFGLEGFDDYYDLGDDNPSGWTESELNGDDINIAYDTQEGTIFFDRVVEFNLDGDDASGLNQIAKDMGIAEEGIYDITWGIYFEIIDNAGAIAQMKIYSDDSTYVSIVKIEEDTGDLILEYYDGSDWHELRDDLAIEEYYEFELYINQFDEIGMLSFYREGVFIERYVIAITNTEKDGISDVILQTSTFVSAGNDFKFELDYIGVHNNGTSVSDDYSWITIVLEDHWNVDHNNLFSFEGKGEFQMGGCTDSYIPEENVGELLIWNQIYNGISLIDLYGWRGSVFTGGIIPDVVLIFYVTTNLTIIDLSIDGVRLIEDVNVYWGVYDNSGVNVNESYFYVIGDVLYFTLTSNYSFLEYMEISFDVGSIYSGNRSLSWKGRKSGTTLTAQFEVNYLDSTYNPFVLESDYKSLTSMLPKSKMIDSFDLLITDNDSDLNDTITGFLGSFILLYNPLISTDFVSLELLDMLPIIVLVVIIPLALYVGFGRKKELLVPAILGMSIFGTVIEIIPFWLTFVIGFACVSYYLIQRGS